MRLRSPKHRGVGRIALSAGVLLLTASCGSATAAKSASSTTSPTPSTVPASTASVPSTTVPPSTLVCTQTNVLDTWPLQRLANQTIVFPVEETDVLATAAAATAGYGGLILFGTVAPTGLGAELAELRAEVPDHLGLVVMTDEEGGGVQRMANLVGSMPWAAQMGATMTPAQIEALAGSVGAKMLANGVTMDLAPVLDVDGRAVPPGPQDPDGFRSFSGNTAVVSADGTAFMLGMKSAGVIPVVKHFPGLGGVSQNTDDGPAWTLPWPTLERVALPPFEAAIAAGTPAVMVSNAMVADFTTVPASLSEKLVTGELRDSLGFKGLIVTDSLSAGAIADAPLSLSVPSAAVEALEAGDDLVEFGSTGSTTGDLALAASTSGAIVAAARSGALSRSQLVNAVAQVLAAKKINLCAG
jgi:beta-N-acetylhexosaminidase